MKRKVRNALYQLVPSQLRLMRTVPGKFKTVKMISIAPIKKEPTNASISASRGFLMVRIPLPSILPTTERIIITPKNSRRPLSPVPVLLAMVEKAGNVIAPARDKRNNNKITATVFNIKELKFMHIPSEMSAIALLQMST
jgi:hypothetical protein